MELVLHCQGAAVGVAVDWMEVAREDGHCFPNALKAAI